MVKALSELSQEELWTLFPIILKPYNPEYPKWYEDMKTHIESILASDIIDRINHIGSTARPNIMSKPTIDILLELHETASIELIRSILEKDQWILMHSQDEPYLRYVFNKGYTQYGFAEKVYHLHVCHRSNWNTLYFRDYLLDYPEIAAEYSKLKERLVDTYRNNRDGYTEAKTDFCTKYTDIARKLYKDRW